MSDYNPDGWVIIRLKSEERTDYKIFGSWAGGYLYGDNWRINSGVMQYTKEDDVILFHGYTSSVYKCPLVSEGRLTGHNSAVLQHMLEKANDSGNGVEAAVVAFEDFEKEFEL